MCRNPILGIIGIRFGRSDFITIDFGNREDNATLQKVGEGLYQGYLDNEPDAYVAVSEYPEFKTVIVTSEYAGDSSIYKYYNNGTVESVDEPFSNGGEDINFDELFDLYGDEEPREERNSTTTDRCRSIYNSIKAKKFQEEQQIPGPQIARSTRRRRQMPTDMEEKLSHKLFDTDNLTDKKLDNLIIERHSLFLKVSKFWNSFHQSARY